MLPNVNVKFLESFISRIRSARDQSGGIFMQLSSTCNTIIACTNERSLACTNERSFFVLVAHLKWLTRSQGGPTALLKDILNVLLVKF